jgi:hypothetical protein
MAGPYKEAARRLYEIAQSQQGFFTTKQATRAGFAEKTHAYHVKVGNWIRGIVVYRLADFPTAESPDLMLWYLWSQIVKKFWKARSHDTALSLHELSDIMPSKLHMTVPKHFSIPTAPTNHPFSPQQLTDLSRRQMAAIRAPRVAPTARKNESLRCCAKDLYLDVESD